MNQTFRASVLVRVAPSNDPSALVEQEVVLDDEFTASQLPLVGSVLQRGSWEAFISAFKQLTVPKG